MKFHLRRWLWAVLGLVMVLDTGCVSSPERIARRTAKDFCITGYLPDYTIATVDTAVGRYLTDIAYFSISPNTDGTLDTSRMAPEHLEWLRSVKQEHGTRILLCIGGWGRGPAFATMALNDDTRARFVATLTQLCLDKGFDGADFDWEFPKNKAEDLAYSQLIIDTKQAFRAHGMRVTVALAQWQAPRLSTAAYAALDYVHLMAYDSGVRHSTPLGAKNGIRRLLKKGVPSRKICLGMPFYGRKIADRNAAAAYSSLMAQQAPQPQEDIAGGFYFNGIDTIQWKTRYALEHKLGGVMFWELGMDTSDETSLLRAIHEKVKGN